jgi:hypothetical protein
MTMSLPLSRRSPGPLARTLWANDSMNCPSQWWRHLLYINTVSPWDRAKVDRGGEDGRKGRELVK